MTPQAVAEMRRVFTQLGIRFEGRHEKYTQDVDWRTSLRIRYENATGRSFRTGAPIKNPGDAVRARQTPFTNG